MQSFTYYNKLSPITKNHRKQQTVDQSITSNKDENSEKLIQQIQALKNNYDQEKQLIQSQYSQAIQKKTNEFRRIENELHLKNQLLEQLLLQEQGKIVSLTKSLHEGSKGTYDKEKESLKSQVKYLEQQIQESRVPQSSRQKPDCLQIQLMDLISNIQKQIITTSKTKRLNISWPEYDILETSLANHKDKPKFVLQLNKIIHNFFQSIQEVKVPSLSPYRVCKDLKTPQHTVESLDSAKSGSVTDWNPLDHKQTQTGLLVPFSQVKQTQTIEQQVIDRMIQCKIQPDLYSKGIQTEQKLIQQISTKISQNIHIQTEEQPKLIAFLKSIAMQTEPVSFKSIEQFKFKNSEVQTIQILSKLTLIDIAVQTLTISTTQVNNSIQTDPKQLSNKESQYQPRQCSDQVSQTIKTLQNHIGINTLSLNSLNQQNQTSIMNESQFTQTDCLENTPKSNKPTKPKKQMKQNMLISDSESASGSEYDINAPSFASITKSEQNRNMKVEVQTKNQQIQLLEQKILETITHYETQILENQNKGKQRFFDSVVKSTQNSILQVAIDKWDIFLREREVNQKIDIGIISMDVNLLQLFFRSLFDDQTVEVEQDFYIKYYNKDFAEGYQIDIMSKLINQKSNLVINSKLKNEQYNYDQFWMDHIISNSQIVIYITNKIEEKDYQIINSLEDKQSIIYVFEDSQYDGYIQSQTFKLDLPKQIINLPKDKNIMQLILQDFIKSDFEWQEPESSFLEQLQQSLSKIGTIEDFQMTMKEDDLFELQVQSDDIEQQNLIPHVQQIDQKEGKVIITMSEQVNNVTVQNNTCIISINDYVLIEHLPQKCTVVNFNENIIELC